MILISVIAVVLLVVLFYMSWSISLGVYLRSICHNREKEDCVAITYDDGVDEILTPQLLDLLDQYGAKASFFVVGERAVKHPDIVRDIVKRGHTIGNHSMCHKGTFPARRTDVIYNEIEECNNTLEGIIGAKVEYFRPPFGVTNPMVGVAVRRAELQSIGWSIRSYDTMNHSVDVVKERVLREIKGGDIILMHDNREGVLQITEQILIFLHRGGYRAVVIDDLLNKAK